MIGQLICQQCGEWFPFKKSRHPSTAGQPAKYCSKACGKKGHYLATLGATRKRKTTPEQAAINRRERAKKYYWANRAHLHRRRTTAQQAALNRRIYRREYWRRPENAARKRAYMHSYYDTDSYRIRARERYQRLYGDRHAGLEIQMPYTGHRWLEMARDAVGRINPDFADYGYNDEVGEALLALLEGRDMKQAVNEFRKKEYIPRYRTLRLGEYRDEENYDWVEHTLPPSPSAEEQALANEAVVLEVKARMNWKKTGMRLSGKTQQPSRRRMKDAGWRKYA